MTSFHYSVTTNKSVDEAVEALEAALKEHKFGVLWKLDLRAKLEEKGVPLDMPYRVLEVCNPHEAKKVLSETPLVGYFLPCKIVVYEVDGKTQIGLPKPTALMDVVGVASLNEIAQGVESTLIQAIEQAK
ncbi:DUF302 domain-containing protein [Ferroacidibacillus organovorans]|uniref:DUF302 domain-containing protein n=1 Tax=Ferroacidibacillus organovorans TaxID=1765683 RepID=A0A162UU95_9BACL|nr:DUF302 domain-containing protein [Ferroacidibacillus organovorans]KYP82054.1 hypothetical protein AYJ22_04965 [Ferroacidibacillus organovorans]OAG94374.1 hypothetical protein AYW79_05785 [Ferroacidibacillus organovorans]OPG15230.1 hypothetical protein B2M26_12215 [Ferroacidibacillus organovorans]